ncbi:MAG: FAA hydrolase family protein [Streptosporangiales bacterium]|nr:FAA hydrolase family protein [Streptosporangiales bacterium]
MRLAIFGESRLGVVNAAGTALVDVTAAVPGHDPDPLTAGWWRALCRDFAALRPALEAAAKEGPEIALDTVRLRPAVLGPSKVIAAACNYADHVTEMHGVQERTLGKVEHWMMDFDVFLKAPSSLAGPADDVVLPPEEVAAGHEIHHESELVVVVGTGGRDIPAETALDHVFGYTLGLDITVRSQADRSRRKSYDTFSPIGPWLTTADETGDPAGLTIDLVLNGEDHRQHCDTADMLMPVPEVIAYASRIMTLHPGDVIFTGAPSGVGPIQAGDLLDTRISRLGGMTIRVR